MAFIRLDKRNTINSSLSTVISLLIRIFTGNVVLVGVFAETVKSVELSV